MCVVLTSRCRAVVITLPTLFTATTPKPPLSLLQQTDAGIEYPTKLTPCILDLAGLIRSGVGVYVVGRKPCILTSS